MTATTWTEQDSAQILDAVLTEINLFTVYKEVPGVLMQPQPAQIPADRSTVKLRIDRLLIPKPVLTGNGWRDGAVGVEIKSTLMAADGKVLSQALDYKRCVWTLPTTGIRVWLDWLFIFPMEKQAGPVASLMAQNRIGTATTSTWVPLQFKAGEQNILRVRVDGELNIGQTTTGRKAGSR